MKRLTKEEIRELPLFEGVPLNKITVIIDQQGSALAISKLSEFPVLGFDTESKPTFRKGEKSLGPHIIQLSCLEETFIFPTKYPSTAVVVLEILGNQNIKKVGFGLKDDINAIYKMFETKVVNTVDLSTKVQRFTSTKQLVGAQAAVAMIFKKRLSKSAQISNWSKFPLSELQLKYAANDSFAALCVENRMKDIINSQVVR